MATISYEDWARAPLEARVKEMGFLWGSGANLKEWVHAVALGNVQCGNKQENGISAALAVPFLQRLSEGVPFRLGYRDAADREWGFTVRHCTIEWHEKRPYLDIWADETEGNQDIPGLNHNWCLRLDRITAPSFTPVEGEWRADGLDTINAEMHLFGGLAHAYEPRPGEEVEWLDDTHATKRVLRPITSSFWFIREVLRYGQDCLVVNPVPLQARVKENLLKALLRYNQQVSE